MKIDLYTKALLTVIAACLVWICAIGGIPALHAQPQPAPARVVLVDERGVAISTIPVTITNQTLPVAITTIERRGSWQPIAVDVMRPPPTLMPTP